MITLKYYIVVTARLLTFSRIVTIIVIEVIDMPLYPKHDDTVCGNCVHFVRHYIRDGSRYISLTMGHCVCLRSKDREEGSTCPSWRPREKK